MNASVARCLLLALLLGSSLTFIRVSSQLVLSRLVLGAAVLLVIAGFRKTDLPRSVGVWGHVAVAGLFGNVISYLLLAYGEQATGAGIAGVLVGSTPLFTVVLATAALPAERGTFRDSVGLLVGFLGVVPVVGLWHDSPGSVSGWLACFGTALSYAASFVYVRRYLSPQGFSPLALAASQLTAAATLQALAIPFLAWNSPRFTGEVTVSVIILGLLSTGVAYVLCLRLIGEVGATTASAVNYLVPVGAVLVSMALLGKPVTWNVFVGGLVLLIAMAYAKSASSPLVTLPAPRRIHAWHGQHRIGERSA